MFNNIIIQCQILVYMYNFQPITQDIIISLHCKVINHVSQKINFITIHLFYCEIIITVDLILLDVKSHTLCILIVKQHGICYLLQATHLSHPGNTRVVLLAQ